MSVDWQIPEQDEVEVALVQYETDTSTDAKRFSIHLCERLMSSAVFYEIVRRVQLAPPESQIFTAIHAGIEIGYRLRQLQQEQPKASASPDC